MSAAVELGRAEADEVEAAEADDAADREPEPEPQPEPEAKAPPVDPERAFKALEKESERHAAALAKIMGDDFALLHVCPGCAPFMAGYTFDPPSGEPQLREAPDTERCASCDGYGDVTTGARSETRPATKACISCGGQGYILKSTPAAQPTPATDSYPGASIGHIPIAGGAPDAWARPAGHPHWGKPPSEVGV